MTDHKTPLPIYMQSLQWAFMTLAFLILLAQLASGRSFWMDESNLALNIRDRTFAELIQPLDNYQAAPVGFLFTVKAITSLLGYNDTTLRLLTLICGMITIVLTYRVSKQISPYSTPLALALIATSPLHTRYALEFKQYALDSALALLYISAMMSVIQAPTHRNIAWATALGVIGVWFSHPIIFVLAGGGFVVFVRALLQYDWGNLRYFILMGISQLVSFGVVYIVAYRKAVSGSYVADFMNTIWQGEFLQLTFESIMRISFEVFTLIGGLYNPALLILGIFGFVIGVIRIRKIWLSLLLSPILFMCIASLLQLYPLSHRFMLFTFAPIMIVMAYGWSDMVEKISQLRPLIGAGILAGLCILLIIRIDVPFYNSEVKPALAFIEAHRLPDEPIYASVRMSPTANHYNYDYTLFSTTIPTEHRMWVIAEFELSEKGINRAHVQYPFEGVWVSCIPIPDRECPTER